jgi:DNA-binding transcriptional LysR family regulator
MRSPFGANVNRDDVRDFVAVRAARSIKGAARALKVDHTTVSRRLAALELGLGASLFERTPDGMVETDVGRAIAPLAERMEIASVDLPRREDDLAVRLRPPGKAGGKLEPESE